MVIIYNRFNMINKYKYDFHCHVTEGSIDSKVSAKQCIDRLINNGFSGCLITDHDNYNGYKYLLHNISFDNFYVLKGIEYSTIDAGHILVIMPDEYDSKDIELPGAHLIDLINYVHKNGGILGPAHPFSEPYLSIFNSKKYRNDFDICSQFDFIEVLNAGEKEDDNNRAIELSKIYNLPMSAGSDCHYIEHCGSGFVEIDKLIKNNNELIDYIKNKGKITPNGELYINHDRLKQEKYGKLVYFLAHFGISIASLRCKIK